MLHIEGPPTQQTHTHDAALVLLCLFQEGGSVFDFQEGGADPFVDLVAIELEFLDLGDDYVDAMREDEAGGIVDVADGIAVAADVEALSPVRNLGERLVVLERLFNDFESNIIGKTTMKTM